MNAIILAAGRGTRLMPLTVNKPKCMVELMGLPLLERQVRTLNAVGFTDITVVGGYKAEALPKSQFKIVINPRFESTNMVSSLFCAESLMRSGTDLLITYGDIVYETGVVRSLMETDAPIAVSVNQSWYQLWSVRMENPLDDAETLKLNKFGEIIEIGKKPKSLEDIQGQYMGLIRIRGDFVRKVRKSYHDMSRSKLYDRKTFDNMYMTSFLQHLIDTGYGLRPVFTNGGWLEVDTLADLKCYEDLALRGDLGQFINLY